MSKYRKPAGKPLTVAYRWSDERLTTVLSLYTTVNSSHITCMYAQF